MVVLVVVAQEMVKQVAVVLVDLDLQVVSHCQWCNLSSDSWMLVVLVLHLTPGATGNDGANSVFGYPSAITASGGGGGGGYDPGAGG